MLVETDENRAPTGGQVAMIRAEDGAQLRAAWWQPGAGRSRGTVCLFNGRSEFIEKYYETIRDLRARGFAVATFDWRGQGGSVRLTRDTRLGHIRHFSAYHRDVDALMRQVAFPECRPPYYALAHSMGGAILFEHLAARPQWFERLVAAAPMIGLPNIRMRDRLAVSFLAGLGFGRLLTPGFRRSPVVLKPFEGNPVTSDPVRYRAAASIAEARPEIAIGGPTIGWVRAAFRSMAALQDPDFGRDWRVPSLIVCAGVDRVVDTEVAERFARRMRATSVVVVPGARHELLSERDLYRDQFLAAFDSFVPGSGR